MYAAYLPTRLLRVLLCEINAEIVPELCFNPHISVRAVIGGMPNFCISKRVEHHDMGLQEVRLLR